jgi:hypothetical protein
MADVTHIGTFDKVIEVYKVTNSKGAQGQIIKDRSLAFKAYASVIEQGLDEQEVKSNVKITRGLDVTTYLRQIDTLYELKYKDRFYKITKITPNGVFMSIEAYD